MSSNTTFSRHIIKVINFLEEEYNIEVIFSGAKGTNSELDPKNKVITIYSKVSKEIQLYILLHEAGHAITIYNNKHYKRHYPFYYISDTNKRTTKKQRVDVVREEIEAWEQGILLAEELNIKINMKHYQHHYRRNLWTYIEWAVNPKQKSYWPLT